MLYSASGWNDGVKDCTITDDQHSHVGVVLIQVCESAVVGVKQGGRQSAPNLFYNMFMMIFLFVWSLNVCVCVCV